MSERAASAHDPAYASIHPLRIKGRIGILTGGGDVLGLNPAIRAVFRRATQEGYEVVGIRRGWAGLIDPVRVKGGVAACHRAADGEANRGEGAEPECLDENRCSW